MAIQNTDLFLVNRSGSSYKVNFSDITTGILGGSTIDADTLDGLDSTAFLQTGDANSFLKSDQADEATGKITFTGGIETSNFNLSSLQELP